jgi:adenosylcobinamide kinase/adenosylcobinamide-phosphate guanylyltransferase
MGKSILITGGARSGKSKLAEQWTLRAGTPAFYIATCRAYDDEMATRIATHQARRGPEWKTIADPLHLVERLAETDGQGPRLIDCLTLWLSNLMEDGLDWQNHADALAETLAHQRSPVTMVTNEVGLGIVPEHALSRAFRDAQGTLNQTIAEAADEVYLAVAGYPLKVKPNANV